MTNRRTFLQQATSAALLLKLPDVSFGQEKKLPALNRIAFGSCMKSWKSQNVWKSILQNDPDLFLFLGDTIYADKQKIKQIGIVKAFEDAYASLNEVTAFKQFRQHVPMLATWDDHDYGPREGGRDFPDKEKTRELFLDFWQVNSRDKRRTQPGGIFAAYEYGPVQQRVQIILLDTRFGRSPLIEVSATEFIQRQLNRLGPYLPNESPDARFLSDEQWTWLEKILLCPAKVRIICSSVSFSAGYRGWESWANFPLEKQRLVDLIYKTKANGVFFVSGDSHYGDLSCETKNVPYPLWDITSSGLTHFWPIAGPNSNRASDNTVNEINYGLIQLFWDKTDPTITFQIHDVNGELKIEHSIRLSSLQMS